MTQVGVRLPAAERRQAIVEAAISVFASASYGGATTAEIARCAGVSEPVLYRHFRSKRDLYFACVETVWHELRTAWEAAIADSEPRERLQAMSRAALARRRRRGVLANLWVQAVTQAGEDPDIRRYVRRHMREVHAFIADAVRSAQQDGAVSGGRDAGTEAWIFIAVGLLSTFAERLGGLLSDDDLAAIAEARIRGLAGP
jgi:AcrR family transcriptional regulator